MTEAFCSEGRETRSTGEATRPAQRPSGRPGTSTGNEFGVGDRVEWETPAGRACSGRVVGVVPAYTCAAGLLRRLGIKMGRSRSEPFVVSCRTKYIIDTGVDGWKRYVIPWRSALRPASSLT